MGTVNHRFPLSGLLVIATMLLLLAVPPAVAGMDDARLREELDQILARLAQEGALGSAAMTVETPARRAVNFGAVVDRDHVEGLLVLGVLPGGGAEALGLHSGDRLLTANAVDLVGRGGRHRLRDLLALLDHGEEITLKVARGDATLTVSGRLEVHSLPAARLQLTPVQENTSSVADADSTCARVSVFPAAPTARDLFPVTVLSIDDRSGTSNQESFRVTPGRQVISVVENIDNNRFSPLANHQRSVGGRERYKSLEIDARAGVTYFIAARFHRQLAGRVAEGAYWEPVVWKERAERCR